MKLITLNKDPNIKINNEITYYLDPDFTYMPADKILVKQNASVAKNMVVCDSLPSPISGIAYGHKKCQFLNGAKDALVIENDFREWSKKNTHPKSVNSKNIVTTLEHLKNYSLLKRFKNKTKFSNIVISAIEDEPYVYNNIYILRENITSLLELIDTLSLTYKSTNNYLVVKNTDTSIINECLNTIGTYPNIKLTLVTDEYLLGKENYLLERLNITTDTLFLSTKELSYLSTILTNQDDTTMLITISGDAILESKVLRLKKYVAFSDVLSKFFKITEKDYKVIVNGLMCGREITTDFIIDDSVTSIFIMKKVTTPEPCCLNCGKCIEICPVSVNPLSGKNKEKCLDCGLCTYICPGFVNLRNSLKGGKHD